MQDATESADDAIATDGGVVVHGRASTQRSVVVDMHVATQHNVVGHDDPITDFTIVGHMAASHQIAVTADGGDSVLFFRGAVDGDRLAKDITVADDDLGGGPLVTKILRFSTNHNTGEKVVLAADGTVPCQRDVIFQPRAVANFGIRTDHTMMANAHFVIQFGSRINHRCVCDNSGHIKPAFPSNLL